MTENAEIAAMLGSLRSDLIAEGYAADEAFELVCHLVRQGAV